MATSGSLDTNILLGILIGEVPEQTPRIDALLNSNKSYAVSDIAICETAYTLKSYYKFDRKLIAENIFNLISIPNLVFDRQKYLDTLKYFLNYPSLSFNDCLLSVEAKLTNSLPLFTFDQTLAKKLDEVVEL